MDDKFNNDLKKRIKEVFENYEDTSSADEGWLQLRKEYPVAQPDRRVVAWIWGVVAAAILLLFLGIGLWVFNKDIAPQKLTLNISKPKNEKKQIANNRLLDSIKNTEQNFQAKQRSSQRSINQTAAINQQRQPVTTVKKDKLQLNVISSSNKLIDTNSVVDIKRFVPVSTPDTLPKTTYIAAAKSDTANNAVPLKSEPKPAEKTIATMFAGDKQKSTEKQKDKGKKVVFGVYAGSFFNYAKGSDNQINAGAGVSSEIRISTRLRLVTGAAIAQNTLNYMGSIPEPAVQYNILAVSAVARPAAFTYAAEPTLKDYNASLIGLDIPLNLKYEFNPQRRDTYVLIGLSSGTFINQSYTTQYNYPSFFTASAQQTAGETTSKNFSDFYFAKTLNFAFGIGYPLGKNHLVIEPFFKYPLEGLGAQQIRFGSGGINLKFNLRSITK